MTVNSNVIFIGDTNDNIYQLTFHSMLLLDKWHVELSRILKKCACKKILLV